MPKGTRKRPRQTEEEEETFNPNTLMEINDEFENTPASIIKDISTSRPAKRICIAAGEGGSRAIERTMPMDR